MNNLGIYASITAILLLVSIVVPNVLSDPYNIYVSVTGVILFSISFVLLMQEMSKRNKEYNDIQNEIVNKIKDLFELIDKKEKNDQEKLKLKEVLKEKILAFGRFQMDFKQKLLELMQNIKIIFHYLNLQLFLKI